MSLLRLPALLGEEFAGTEPVALCNGMPMTRARWRGDIRHNAARFERSGVRRALLCCEDAYQFLVGLVALLAIGADIVLPPNLQSGTIAALANDFDALVTDGRALGGVRTLALESAEPSAAPLRLDPARSRIDFFTSGSTGATKRVTKSWDLLEREAAMLERAWGERIGGATIFGTVTHQHIFGLAFRVVWPLLTSRIFAGGAYFAWETLLAELPPRAVIISSPAHLTRLAGLSPLPAPLRPRLLFTAGAPLPAAAARECEMIFGAPPIEIFGSTETGAFAWRCGVEPTAWWPLPGVELSCGDAGLLRVRSPALPDGSCCDLADRVSLTDDGGFRFEGRADRIVKIEGKRISLDRLEQDLVCVAGVDGAAVMPLGEERLTLGAIVALNEEGRAELARLGKFRFERRLRQALAATQDQAGLPRRWRFVDKMPVDGMGKRRIADLAALLEAAP